MDSQGTPLRVTLDASVFLAVCLNGDEAVEGAFSELFERPGTRVVQPVLWIYEVLNGLRSAEKRLRLDEGQSRRAILDLAALPLQFEDRLPMDAAAGLLTLARESALSVYDAAYIYFCLNMKTALWTLDGQLRRAAQNAGLATL